MADPAHAVAPSLAPETDSLVRGCATPGLSQAIHAGIAGDRVRGSVSSHVVAPRHGRRLDVEGEAVLIGRLAEARAGLVEAASRLSEVQRAGLRRWDGWMHTGRLGPGARRSLLIGHDVPDLTAGRLIALHAQLGCPREQAPGRGAVGLAGEFAALPWCGAWLLTQLAREDLPATDDLAAARHAAARWCAVRNDLVEASLGFVVSIARRAVRAHVPLEDCVQAGSLALTQAIERFDPTRGTRLTTYLGPVIERAIRALVQQTPPSPAAPRVGRSASLLGLPGGRTGLHDDGMWPGHRRRRRRPVPVSIDAVVEDTSGTLGDRLIDPEAPGPDALAIAALDSRSLSGSPTRRPARSPPRVAWSAPRHPSRRSLTSLMTLDEILAALHPTQSTAVTHPARPLLLACGPGSGKTRILTHRIQWLVQHEGFASAEVLALTFSRAAADELRGRLSRALGSLARSLWAGTFHGFGAWLLRRHAATLGRTAAILDREDTRRLIARLVEELGVEGDLATLVEAVERAKGQHVPEVGHSAASLSGPLASLLVAYETRCREANAFDFTDLLTAPLALFQRKPIVRDGLRTRFRAVLVDEAQDLCALQHALVETLAAPEGAVTFAGDDDQAIYGWRGGDVARLHAFERTYPGGTVLAVGRNYRSTPQIVGAAARLIGHNRARRHKPLAAVRPAGPLPQVLTWTDDRAEAEGLATCCPDWLRLGAPPIAILARVTACLAPIARACEARGLTVRVLAERPLAERAAVRDLLAVCRALVNPLDWLAWERVLRVHRCGVGARTLAALRGRVRVVGVAAALREAARSRRRLAGLLDRLQGWRATPPRVTTLLETVAGEIYGHSAEKTEGPHDDERNRRVEDVATLLALAHRWEAEAGGGLSEFLDTVVLTEEDAPTSAGTEVLGLTLHAAKGLEFDTVVIVGAEEGLMPHYRHTAAESLAEERRLCYVGMTRARQRLVFSVSRMRRLWGDVAFRPPSRFLRESGLGLPAVSPRTAVGARIGADPS